MAPGDSLTLALFSQGSEGVRGPTGMPGPPGPPGPPGIQVGDPPAYHSAPVPVLVPGELFWARHPQVPSLSLQGPAGLEGLDGKDGKPGLRVRRWGVPGFEGQHHPIAPGCPQPMSISFFLPRVTPAPPGHQG